MELVKWPSIEQFRHVVKAVQRKAQFVKIDENGEVIVNRNAPMPTLKFQGTVKLHGTNAAVGYNGSEMWCQSRERIITPENDNAGFAAYVAANKELFESFNLDKEMLIYGEWCGGNIQKGVALSQLPKMFVVFGIRTVDTHLPASEVVSIIGGKLKTVYDFQTFEVEVNFARPELSQNVFNEITEKVESECPAGKHFGVSGIGEGVVWRCTEEGWNSSDFWFKVKGEAHSKSKVKTLATVDVEKIENLNKLCEKLANKERLDQVANNVFNLMNGGEIDTKRTGEFIKGVTTDILKEESDTIDASGFTTKDIGGTVAKICRTYLFESV